MIFLGASPSIVLAFGDFTRLAEGVHPIVECFIQGRGVILTVQGDDVGLEVLVEILTGFAEGHGFSLVGVCEYYSNSK